jgi:hypothetical protein
LQLSFSWQRLNCRYNRLINNSGGAPTTGSNTRVGDAPANGAPVGNGTIILFMLAAAYAGRKVYQLHHTVETL